MIITITSDIITKAIHRSLECPVYLALVAASYDVGFVNVGREDGRLTATFYHMHNDEALIQPLPAAVGEIILAYDKVGKMEPFAFELPDLP